MQTSEATDKIIPAFVKAQGEVGKAVKSSENQHFRSKYADLEEVFSACRDALKSNGLAVFQTVTCDGEQMRMITRIYHESGQWIEGACPLILAKRDMQGLGSASTYARRYGLMAAMGIAPEDDDGEAASRPAPNGNGKRTPQQPQTLPADKSNELADILIEETVRIKSGADLQAWAARRKPDVDSLAPADRDRVRDAYAAKLNYFKGQSEPPHDPETGELTENAA